MTTAGCSPTDCPRTAASRACCTCSTWKPGTSLPTGSPARGRPTSPGCPTASGFYYTRYPAPGEVPEGEEHYHRAVYFHRARRRSRRRSAGLQARAEGVLARRGPLARRPLAADRRGPHLRPDRPLPAATASGGAPLVAVAEDLPASFDGEVAHGRLYLRTNLDAPTYRLYAVDPEQPERGALARAGAAAARRGAGRCARDRRPAWRSSYLERASSRLRLTDLDGGHASARSTLPDARQPVRARRRVGRRRAVLRLLVLHRAAQRVPDRPGHRRRLSLWRRVEADVDPERFEVRQVQRTPRDGTAITHVPGPPRGLARER